MKSLLKKILMVLSGSQAVQELLNKTVRYLQYLMGIGAGSSTIDSGEAVILKHLKNRSSNHGERLVIIDAGANEGKFIDLCTEHLKQKEYYVHAFEPSMSAFDTLQQKYGCQSNIKTNRRALGDVVCRMPLYYDVPGSELGSLYKRKLDHFGIELTHSETVDVTTLDTYCREEGIAHIDLLKMDVEGHELQLLRGCEWLFSQKMISVVSFEFGGCNIDSRTYFQDIYYLLAGNGFTKIFRITPSGYALPIRSYDETLEQFRTTNYFAVRD